jgi:hypothetical protein
METQMSTARETVFECTYDSAARRETAFVRAWDAREAVELFAHELEAAGVAEEGCIRVRARSGERTVTSPYPAP